MLIKRILILTEDGLPIFDFEEYSRGDEALVGGLITALIKFAEETEKETISRVMLQESQFILTKKEGIIFVFQVFDEISAEYAELLIALISNDFFRNFGEEAKKFTGNVTGFIEFQERCREILEDAGLPIVNLLIQREEKEESVAWAIFSPKGNVLLVRTSEANYNIDSFAIMQVIGKSLRKILKVCFDQVRGSSLHISPQGKVIHTIVLPYTHLSIERELSDLNIQTLKKFKIKTQNQLEEMINHTFEPIGPYEMGIISKMRSSEDKEKENKNLPNLQDFCNAAKKGFQYLFNSTTIIQIINSKKKSHVLIDLPNRQLSIGFNQGVKSELLVKKAIEFIRLE